MILVTKEFIEQFAVPEDEIRKNCHEKGCEYCTYNGNCLYVWLIED